jgi:hypothetical protein
MVFRKPILLTKSPHLELMKRALKRVSERCTSTEILSKLTEGAKTLYSTFQLQGDKMFLKRHSFDLKDRHETTPFNFVNLSST